MRKVKIAQIGTSLYSHGNIIFETLKRSEFFEIIGFALPENEKEKFPECTKVFEGYPEMTVEEILENPDIEAVIIETEEIYLTKYALLAAEYGKHIHMEKPGGISLAEFKFLIDITKRKQLIFHIGYMYRYNPYIMKLIKRIKNDELGEIISVEAQMSCFHAAKVRNWIDAFPGGMMFFLGCHLVDLILQIQGIPNKIIPLNKCSNAGASKDFGMAVFEYDNGVSFVKTSAVEHGGYTRRQLVVSGTKGTVEIRPLECNDEYPLVITGYREVFSTDWNADSETRTTEKFDRYDNMMSSFAEMVCDKKENPWNYDYELTLFETILKCCGGEIL